MNNKKTFEEILNDDLPSPDSDDWVNFASSIDTDEKEETEISLVQLQKELNSRSLFEFIKYFWDVVEGPDLPYVHGEHIPLICTAYEKLIANEFNNLGVELPPGFMKSKIGVVYAPVWMWTLKPSLKMCFSTYADALTVRDSRLRRALMEHPKFTKMYGDVFGIKVRNSKKQVENEDEAGDANVKLTENYIENNKKGFMMATSVTGKATGFRFDMYFGDDLLNATDANSETEKQKVVDHLAAMSTRAAKPAEYKKIIIGQRLAEDDAGGYARNNGFIVLKIPMQFYRSEDESNEYFKDWRTEEGEFLMPIRFAEKEKAEQIKAIGSAAYSAQFQQKPVPKNGGIIKSEWIQFYNPKEMDKLGKIYCTFTSWDTAYTDKVINDASAAVTFGVTSRGIVVLGGDEHWKELPELLKAVRVDAILNKIKIVTIEDKGTGKNIIQLLNRDTKRSFRVVSIVPTLSKSERCYAATPFIESGRLLLPDNAFGYKLKDKLIRFPGGKHRDLADACIQGILWAETYFVFRQDGEYKLEKGLLTGVNGTQGKDEKSVTW